MKYPIGGVIIEKRDTDFIVGDASGVEYKIVNESGDWEKYLPSNETQGARNGDTAGCVTFSALNVCESSLNFMLHTGKLRDDIIQASIDMGYLEEEINYANPFK